MSATFLSVFVRNNCVDVARRAIIEAMEDAGYVTLESHDRQATRRMVLSQSGAWIKIQDSAFGEGEWVALELSRRLTVWSFVLRINSMDEWEYRLYRDGQQLDHFVRECHGEFEDVDDDFADDGLPFPCDGSAVAEAASLEERLDEVANQPDATVNADDLLRRIERGEATDEEIRRFNRAAAEARSLQLDEISQVLRTTRSPSAASEADLTKHVACLSALVTDDISRVRINRILTSDDDSIENVAAEFLDVLGWRAPISIHGDDELSGDVELADTTLDLRFCRQSEANT